MIYPNVFPVHPSFHGAFAALLTPRKLDGTIDAAGFERNINFVLESGVAGVVVAGGTGEYADLSVAERKALFAQAAAANRGRGALIASAGAMRLADSADLAAHAFALEADAVLLPPPHFYRYGQPDLEAFYRAAAERISGPLLIYNLAAFCSPVEPETIVRLIESVPNIVGVKDSSGSLDALEMLTARDDLRACRILGHDKVLGEALRRGLLDAVISGPSSVMPEIVVKLFETSQNGDTESFEKAADLFNELISRLDFAPYPAALKLIARTRGLFDAALPFPPSEKQLQGAGEFEAWFGDWQGRFARAGLSQPLSQAHS